MSNIITRHHTLGPYLLVVVDCEYARYAQEVDLDEGTFWGLTGNKQGLVCEFDVYDSLIVKNTAPQYVRAVAYALGIPVRGEFPP